MTAVFDVPTLEAPEPTLGGPDPTPLGGEPAPEEPEGLEEARSEANFVLVGLATFLATAAAGWMAGGMFRGTMARLVAMAASALGTAIATASGRTRRPSIVQWAVLPIAMVAGAAVALAGHGAGESSLPRLVSSALHSGGLSQPPVAFEPGWRFLLVMLITLLGAAGVSLALALDRPKLGVGMTTPVLFGTALFQPRQGSLLSAGVAFGLFVASLAVAFGAELARDGATSGSFELRRLLGGAAIVFPLVAGLVALSRAGFLFPEPNHRQVVPPKRPETQSKQPDRVLFTVRADRPVPWRLGVLDVYDGRGWLTPPYDTSRFQAIGRGGNIPVTTPAAPRESMMEVRFRIENVPGHIVPDIASPVAVVPGRRLDVRYDPRDQTLHIPGGAPPQGLEYVVRAPAPPSGADLARAPAPPASLRPFLEAPTPPPEIAAILSQAPTTNAFERLQFVRTAFYQRLVAAGVGNPVDVPPARVVRMLAGDPASPYEITAADALLARWAGVPARIGYGYFGGDGQRGVFEIHPRHGATWLEAYFEGFGWVPIIGQPPKAKASLNPAKKNETPAIRPTDELALVVYLFVRLHPPRLLYELVRYWVARLLPWALGLGLLWGFGPGFAKIGRTWRRRRWAHARGPRERILVAYAELRDATFDLNIGDPGATPMEYLGAIEPDREHTELAWLVTRGLWGDLTRDLRQEDAELAEEMGASVLRRIRGAQPLSSRVLAFGVRSSLRQPWTTAVPNVWRFPFTRIGDRPSRRHRVWRRLVSASMALLLLGGCTRQATPTRGRHGLPPRVAPETIDGVSIRREPKAEAAFSRAGKEAVVGEGRVYTLHQGTVVQGSLQVGAFKPGLESTRREVRSGVLNGIGEGRFQRARLGGVSVYVMQLPEQRIFLWFSPDGSYYDLLVARSAFADAEQLFSRILAYQRGTA